MKKKMLIMAILATTAASAQKPTISQTKERSYSPLIAPEARLDRIELNLQRFKTQHERGGLLIMMGVAATVVGYVVADPKDRPWVIAPGCALIAWGAGTVYFAGRELGKR